MSIYIHVLCIHKYMYVHKEEGSFVCLGVGGGYTYKNVKVHSHTHTHTYIYIHIQSSFETKTSYDTSTLQWHLPNIN